METNRHVASAFLSQPEPFPERLIGADPDFFCETCLVGWGAQGLMHTHFDIGAEWRRRCTDVRTESLPGGHFFVDQFGRETARVLADFLAQNSPVER